METIEINEFKDLSYGENIHQPAVISPVPDGLDYEIMGENDDLEYLDFLNMTKAVEVLAEFFDVSACSLSNEAKLCAVALGSSSDVAFGKILENDPVSVAGGTVCFSKEVTNDIALQLKAMKVRNVLAPSYDKVALDYLIKCTGLHVIKIKSPLQELLGFNTKDIKVTPFGYLIQEQNTSKLTKSSFKVAGKIKPTQQLAEDAIFAWKIAKYSKSKVAVVVKDLATRAIVQGEKDLADAAENAMDISCESSKESVLAVDGVIEQEEVIDAAIQGRVGLIIEAGDSEKSDKIVKLADKYNICIINTGIRNNRY